jgi:hypothetical protein
MSSILSLCNYQCKVMIICVLQLKSAVSRYNERQRSSVAAVRDCGLLSCQATPNFERGRMLELPLKPLLLLHFVALNPTPENGVG